MAPGCSQIVRSTYVAAASAMAMCPSCPQACILPGWIEAKAAPVASAMGSASISARIAWHARTNASVEESADAAGTRMGHLASERRQHALDIGDSLRKIEIELRNAMEIAAIATEFLELGHRESLREAHLLQLIVIQDCGTHVSSILLHFLNVIYEYSCLVKCNVIGSLPLDRGAGTKSRGRAGRL